MALNPRFNLLKKFFKDKEKSDAQEKEETLMKDIEKEEKGKCIELRPKEKEIDLHKTFRSEFHFLKFPFFDLCPRLSQKDKIEIKEVEETEEGKIEIIWRVSRNIESRFPSSFARKLHKEVVEKTLNNLQKPVSRLVRLGSLRQICKSMKITPSGKNMEEIKKAFKDIQLAGIEAKGTFRQKEKNGAKKFFEGVFNLYSSVFFSGETLPDGTKADEVYILLNDMYAQNFNNNFVVPMDYEYFQSLRGDIASRMYEVLSVWFYPALENGKGYIQKKYSELCNYFPLTRQDTKWKAKGQLKGAHQQHILSGFLASEPEWIDTNEKNDWIIRYYIGQKTRDWYKENRKLSHIDENIKKIEEPKIEEPKRVREGKKENSAKQTEEASQAKEEKPEEKSTIQPKKENPLISKLISAGISKGVAKNLVEHSSPAAIEDWIEAVRTIKADDKAAFLVRAIKEEWFLPESFRKEKEKRIQEEKEKREEELKAQYNKFLKEKIDPCLEQMDQAQREEEFKKQEEIFVTEYSFYKDIQGMPSLRPYVMAFYREAKRKEMGLPSFEEWVREQENKKERQMTELTEATNLE